MKKTSFCSTVAFSQNYQYTKYFNL